MEYNSYSRAHWPWLLSPGGSWQSPASHSTLPWKTKLAGEPAGYWIPASWSGVENLRRLAYHYYHDVYCLVNYTLGKTSDLGLLPCSVWWWPPPHCLTWLRHLNPETSWNNPATLAPWHKWTILTESMTRKSWHYPNTANKLCCWPDSGNVHLSLSLRKLFWSLINNRKVEILQEF